MNVTIDSSTLYRHPNFNSVTCIVMIQHKNILMDLISYLKMMSKYSMINSGFIIKPGWMTVVYILIKSQYQNIWLGHLLFTVQINKFQTCMSTILPVYDVHRQPELYQEWELDDEFRVKAVFIQYWTFPPRTLWQVIIYTGWPRKNATILIVNFKDIVNRTNLFFVLLGRQFISQQNDTMTINFG